MIKKLITLTALIIPICLFAKNFTISGYILDDSNGETLIAASVFDLNSKKGVLSNSYGFYSLTLPEGDVNIQYSCIGYAELSAGFVLNKDTVLNIRLTENNILEAITVTGTKGESPVQASQMSAITVPVTQIKAIPALLGEVDLIKALQLLPGVQSGTEGFAGFYVRGGGPDENLFLLDGVPVYNINHMAGFFSVFNADAIKNVTLYKGGFPARFGGRLSSVLDVHMNDGNNKKISGNISVGLISSKFNLEGPLFSEKTTFNISARRTYFDILARPFMKTFSEGGEDIVAGYYFYDINAKLSHKFSDNDRLYLSFYMGDDAIYAKMNDEDNYYETEKRKISRNNKMDWNWGNLLSVLRWNHIINKKLFMNTTLTYTRYRFDLGIAESQKSDFPNNNDFDVSLRYKSGIEDFAGKVDFDYSPDPHHDIKFGVGYTNHKFRPGISAAKMSAIDGSMPIDTAIGNKNIFANEFSLYAEDNINIGSIVKMNAGLHYSAFAVQNTFYHSLQPRLSLRFLLSDKFSVKAGYAYMSQYIHLLSNSSISLPTDLWVPVTKRIVPMNSHQISLGTVYNLNNFVDISVEGYYKLMDNLIEYKDGATFMGSSTGWEDKVSMGSGRAYGIEFLAQKTVGKLTGWVGYTLARTERQFNRPGQELNFGKVFPAKYDRRHDLSVVASYKFSNRVDVSGTWVYGSGNAATLGLQEFSTNYQPFSVFSDHIYISERNNYRYPSYHRLDLSVNLHKQKKYGKRTWSFGVYNVYNRMNPFFVYQDEKYVAGTGPSDSTSSVWQPDGSGYVKVLKQVTIFPIMPSISYTYSF